MVKNQKEGKIQHLSQQQFLIKRMNLYFGRELGDSDYPYSTQKSIAVREVLDNAIDAIRKLFKRDSKATGNLKVVFYEDYSFEVYDSGGGIPVDIMTTADGKKATSLFVALGLMNSGSNYENVTDSAGTNGVGGAGAQMLSEYMRVEVYRDKKVYKLDFKDNTPGIFDENGNFEKTNDLTYLLEEKDKRSKEEKSKFPSGTKIKAKLNNEYFKSKYNYNVDDLIERLRGVAYLVPELSIEITNYLRKLEDGSPQQEFFHFEDGLNNLIELNSLEPFTPIFDVKNSGVFKEESTDVSEEGKSVKKIIEKEISVQAVFNYSNNYDLFMDSYVNTIKTRLHGFHVDAFKTAMVNSFNNKFRSMKNALKKDDEDPIFDDYALGLNAVVSVFIPEPEFTNQIKEELGGQKVKREFIKLFTSAFDSFLNDKKNFEYIQKIAEKVVQASRDRIKRRAEIEISREQKKLSSSTAMPIKLVDCRLTHTENSELFIAEGDSALGALKGARNSDYQALLPVRGKSLNVLKNDTKTVLANEEIQNVIKCLSAGFGETFNLEDSRYQNVIIATDADYDGKQIACLIVSLFYKYFRPFIDNGRVYLMNTPLYVIKTSKKTYYAMDETEKEDIINSISGKFTLTRHKGLGEVNADVLEEFGMDPATRRLTRIVIDNEETANNIIETAMGTNVEIRRQWLKDNPVEVEED